MRWWQAGTASQGYQLSSGRTPSPPSKVRAAHRGDRTYVRTYVGTGPGLTRVRGAMAVKS